MPIAPEFRHLYGYAWRTKIRPRVVARCKGPFGRTYCEWCRRATSRIEVAHLDGDPRNRDDENLAGLCSTCHKRHDYPIWAAKARQTRRARKDRGRPLLGEL